MPCYLKRQRWDTNDKKKSIVHYEKNLFTLEKLCYFMQSAEIPTL